MIDRFVAETSGLSEREKAIVLWWKDPVAGIFQVKRILPDGFVGENLINEVEYTIKPTTIPRQLEQIAEPGAFFRAKKFPQAIRNIFSRAYRIFLISRKKRY